MCCFIYFILKILHFIWVRLTIEKKRKSTIDIKMLNAKFPCGQGAIHNIKIKLVSRIP